MLRYIFDPEFKKYGRVIEDFDFSQLKQYMDRITASKYLEEQLSVEEMEKLPVCHKIQCELFHELPVQIGYMSGHNHRIHGVEYHKSKVIHIAATDCVMYLGLSQDIEPTHEYHTSRMEAFFVPKGTAVELNCGVLHCAPCNVNGYGFKLICIAPKHTSEPFCMKVRTEKDKILFARNKWLIAHKDSNIEGAFYGLKGDTEAV